jgi:hypothetical protein
MPVMRLSRRLLALLVTFAPSAALAGGGMPGPGPGTPVGAISVDAPTMWMAFGGMVVVSWALHRVRTAL